jgi:hypothetical protein
MIEYIFVSILCIGTTCEFMTSKIAMPLAQCERHKQTFLNTKFKPEITLAATQCMPFIVDERTRI